GRGVAAAVERDGERDVARGAHGVTRAHADAQGEALHAAALEDGGALRVLGARVLDADALVRVLLRDRGPGPAEAALRVRPREVGGGVRRLERVLPLPRGEGL